MTGVLQLIKRNLKLFFRDKASVFFSLLSVFIIIGLYVLFLGDTIMSSMQELGDSARQLIDNWIMAGVLGIASFTTVMGAFGIMVQDRADRVIRDFYVSPIKKSSLTLGYIFSVFFIGLIMCLVTLILAEIYIVAYGGTLLSLWDFLKVLGILLLSVLSSGAMVFFIVTFLKSNNAFATASTIIGTLIGFITGIYVPIGNLPESVQMVIKIFPVSHAGALLRQVMMDASMKSMFGVDSSQMLQDFKLEMGIVYQFGSWEVTPLMSVGILAASAVLFFTLATLNLKRLKEV